MFRFLKCALSLFALAGVMILPAYGQTGNAYSQSGTMGQPELASPDQNVSQSSTFHTQEAQQTEQHKVTAEGEGWRLEPSAPQKNGGGGEGDSGAGVDGGGQGAAGAGGTGGGVGGGDGGAAGR